RSPPLNYLINQNKRTILLIGFILIIIYYQIFSILYPMMLNVLSKHEYFNEQLQIENEKLNRFKQKIIDIESDHGYSIRKNDITCNKCSLHIWKLDFDYILNHIVENNRYIKKSYDDTLYPLQCILSLINCVNTICIMMIFKEPIKLFLISNLLTIICLSIYGEFFIENKPNVYYTLIFGVVLVLFSCILIIKILLTLFDIIVYQRMKNILTDQWQLPVL
ncbi:unnamed protein product, partial [Rotaria sordida]